MYYDKKQRSFFINNPLQVSFTEDQKIHLRFYSPVGIQNGQVFTKLRGVPQQIELLQIANIPTFADISIGSMLTQRDAVYKTNKG